MLKNKFIVQRFYRKAWRDYITGIKGRKLKYSEANAIANVLSIAEKGKYRVVSRSSFGDEIV